MGTKPAKVAHRPSWPTKAAKPGLFPVTEDLFARRSSLRGRTKVAKVGPLRPGEGSNLLKSRRPLLCLLPPGGCAPASHCETPS
eukprot:scaffold59608_cov57-Phaeocystis_antarctica.AAC.2